MHDQLPRKRAHVSNSKRYDWPLCHNEEMRRDADSLFSGFQRASGEHVSPPVDVWHSTLFALEACPGVDGHDAGKIAAAASRAARAAFLRIRRQRAVDKEARP